MTALQEISAPKVATRFGALLGVQMQLTPEDMAVTLRLMLLVEGGNDTFCGSGAERMRDNGAFRHSRTWVFRRQLYGSARD